MKKIFLLLFFISLGKIKANIEPNDLRAAITFTKDPSRTPSGVNLSDPVNTVDGSGGKYRKKHKHPNGRNFARRKGHAKTVKPKGDNAKERNNSKKG